MVDMPKHLKEGTLAYAQHYHDIMTDPAPQGDETPAQAKSRAAYYAGVDEDGLPSD